MSKPDAPSKQASFDDTNNREYCFVMLEYVDEVFKTMRIEQEPPVDDKIQLTEEFVKSKKCY